MSRDVVLGGLFNVRDLGGYPTADGRRVRWRRLYRGASLHLLQDSARPQLDRLGLRTVLDLRRDAERAAEPWPPALAGLDVRAVPILPDGWRLPLEDFADPVDHLSQAYDDMRRIGREPVRQVFEILAASQSYPLLFFCIAGKDRTGIVAALVLLALGVDEETVLDDYCLSGERVLAFVEELRAQDRLPDNPMIRQSPQALAAPRRAMAGSLERLRAEHGDVHGYLTWCGVPPGQVEALRAALLEPLPASGSGVQ